VDKDIILVDKPKGITSFDVIRRLRRSASWRTGIKKLGHTLKPPKLGHAGTLDPLASGLMIIGIGSGTKKLTEYLGLPKVYDVEVLFGRKTATGDMEGEILEEMKVTTVNHSELKEVLCGMIGTVELPVPAYSAVKQGGVPLYKKARKGQKVEVPIRKMQIKSIELGEIHEEGTYVVAKMKIDVESGVYIRSVAEEIGRRLDLPATVKELRRVSIGDFDIDSRDVLKI